MGSFTMSNTRIVSNCEAEYIDETARKLGTRLNEHMKSVQACDLKSAVSKYAKDASHSIDSASVKIIGQENLLFSRKIRESINIQSRRPELNFD